MSRIADLKEFVSERLHAAASEILGAIEKTIGDYEVQASRLKEENDRHRSVLDIILKSKLPQTEGYRCNLVTQMCEKENLPWVKIPMVRKEAAEEPSPAVLPLVSLQEFKKPMTALTDASHDAYETGVIRCDSRFFCSKGTSCCKGSAGQWNCCPYPLGQCCADGQHCCEYGYTCDPSSMSCRGPYSQVPSGAQEPAKMD
ncbi:granulins-like protein [Lates japonicus]|uniref:Granulins-like protein n=1 Tax=Lates japonicus TaxID=270547 RepID=A0AAD3MR01_LATJO|nr:granulins-like protein [Lates japonicus]